MDYEYNMILTCCVVECDGEHLVVQCRDQAIVIHMLAVAAKKSTKRARASPIG